MLICNKTAWVFVSALWKACSHLVNWPRAKWSVLNFLTDLGADYFVNFFFSYCDGFLQGHLSSWWIGRAKWSPGGHFTCPEGSKCFKGGLCTCPTEKLWKIVLKNWYPRLFWSFFLSVAKKFMKLSAVTVRISSGLFALSLCFCLGGTNWT